MTGASSGLGREMARQLGRRYGARVLATARRADRLEELVAELAAEGREARAFPADLSRDEDVDRLADAAIELGIDGAILNAGIASWGLQGDMPMATFETMLSTNVRSLVRLTNRFLEPLAARPARGGLLFVSSLAGFIPIPYQAAYCGTKAFVNHFGFALRAELRGRGPSVTVYTPGGIATELLDKTELSKKFQADSFGIMPADVCARVALRAFVKRRPYAVPGFFNRVSLFATRLLPRTFLPAALEKAYRPVERG